MHKNLSVGLNKSDLGEDWNWETISFPIKAARTVRQTPHGRNENDEYVVTETT